MTTTTAAIEFQSAAKRALAAREADLIAQVDAVRAKADAWASSATVADIRAAMPSRASRTGSDHIAYITHAAETSDAYKILSGLRDAVRRQEKVAAQAYGMVDGASGRLARFHADAANATTPNDAADVAQRYADALAHAASTGFFAGEFTAAIERGEDAEDAARLVIGHAASNLRVDTMRVDTDGAALLVYARAARAVIRALSDALPRDERVLTVTLTSA